MTSVRLWHGVAILCAVTALLYAPSLRGGFVYDDHWAIVRNNALVNASVKQVWMNPRTGADPASGLTQDVYRPLTVLSFATSVRLWKAHVTGWRLENLLWHLLNGVLFVLLLRRLAYPGGAPLFIAVAIFLLHPLQVSNVAWVYQRGALMSGAGCLAVMLAACAPEPFSIVRFVWGMVALAAALFTKESAVVVPLLLYALSCEYLIARRRWWIGATAIGVAGFLLWRSVLLGGWSQITDMPRGWGERSTLTFLAVPQYAAKFFLPWGLRASYDLPSVSLLRLSLALLGWILFGFLAYRAARQRTLDRAFLVWALVALIPMLPAAPIRAFFAERFFYVSSMGLAALIGLVAFRYPALRGIILAWMVLLGLTTARYAQAWRSDKTVWTWTVQREPANVFARMCLAESLSDPAAAEVQYKAVLDLHPSAAMQETAWNNLAVAALAQNQPLESLQWTDSLLARHPDHPQALFNRWRALKASGHTKAAETLRQILKKDPRIPADLMV